MASGAPSIRARNEASDSRSAVIAALRSLSSRTMPTQPVMPPSSTTGAMITDTGVTLPEVADR